MKKYLLVLFVAFTAQAFSQGRDDQYMPPMQQNQPQNATSMNLYSAKANHYKKMEIKGIVLLSVGAACGGAGAALLADGLNIYNNSTTNNGILNNGMPQIVSGIALSVVGVVGISVGTPLTITGAVKSKKYKQEVSLLFAPTGCKIAFTF